MTEPTAWRGTAPGSTASSPVLGPQGGSANLADILERVLDKGIVIAGDIRINLLDIELLTIKLRLLIASVDKARELGIDWWEHDPSLSSRARGEEREVGRGGASADRALREENERLRAEIESLRAAGGGGELPPAGAERSGERVSRRGTRRRETEEEP